MKYQMAIFWKDGSATGRAIELAWPLDHYLKDVERVAIAPYGESIPLPQDMGVTPVPTERRPRPRRRSEVTNQTPESRSRELAAKATPGPWHWSAKSLPPHDVDVYNFETAAVARVLGGNSQDYGDELVQRLAESNAAFIAFHDPARISAYADVVEAVRTGWRTHLGMIVSPHVSGCPTCYAFGQTRAALARLDALTKDRGE